MADKSAEVGLLRFASDLPLTPPPPPPPPARPPPHPTISTLTSSSTTFNLRWVVYCLRLAGQSKGLDFGEICLSKSSIQHKLSGRMVALATCILHILILATRMEANWLSLTVSTSRSLVLQWSDSAKNLPPNVDAAKLWGDVSDENESKLSYFPATAPDGHMVPFAFHVKPVEHQMFRWWGGAVLRMGIERGRNMEYTTRYHIYVLEEIIQEALELFSWAKRLPSTIVEGTGWQRSGRNAVKPEPTVHCDKNWPIFCRCTSKLPTCPCHELKLHNLYAFRFFAVIFTYAQLANPV